MSFNPFDIFNKIECGKFYIKPFGIIAGLSLIVFDVFIVSVFDKTIIQWFLNNGFDNEFLFNIILFLLEFFVALISIKIILCICIDKSSPTNYSSNFKSSDFIYVILLILGFRFFYDGSISQIQALTSTDKTATIISLELNNLLRSCVYAPFIEEIMYRGILLNGLLKKYDSKIAIFLSSLVFAIMHFNFYQSINAFFIGLILSYIFYRTKSIYLCILLHFVNNFIVSFVPMIYFDSFLLNLPVVIFNLGIGIFLMVFSIKQMNLKERKSIYLDTDSSFNFFI